MEWWSFFRKIRRAIFALIAIVSLAWAVVLSFYLTKEWSHFTLLQRVIVIAMISVNGITTVMLYLMAVILFKIWLDFVRMLFLLTIHIASAVMFTLFGSRFSCVIFKTKNICQDVDVAFLAGSWAITGLLVGYTLYLCIMSRVPFPIPKITPNFLLTTSSSSRRSSLASVTSATHLLTPQADIESGVIEPTRQEFRPRTVPKRLFVVNGMPSPVSPPSRASPSPRTGGSYGAMGSPRVGTSSPAPSMRSLSASIAPSMRQNSLSRGQSFAQKRFPRPDPLPLLNPFADPLSRHGTPETAYSALTFGTAAPMLPVGIEQYPSVNGMRYTSPYQIPPLAHIQDLSSHDSENPPSPSSIYSLYSNKDVPMHAGQSIPTYFSPYDPHTSPAVKSTVSSPSRTLTATPHSFHSVAPSVDFACRGPEMSPPSPIHARSHSDPVYRPYTASPRLIRREPDLHLPNPFPMVGNADVRRFASLAGGSAGGVRQSVYLRNARNATHLQAALGRTPPRTVHSPPTQAVSGRGPIPGTMDRSQWKQPVVGAAVGGR